MNRPRSPGRWSTLLAASLACLPWSAAHADAAKNFPEFAARKETLGSITLLVDSYSVINIQGKVERAKLDQGRAAGEEARDALLEALTAHGYRIDTSVVVSAGANVRTDWVFTSKGDVATPPPADSLGEFCAPFSMDTTWLRDPESCSAWTAMVGHLVSYKKRPRDSAGFFPEAGKLRNAMRGDVLAAVAVECYGVSQNEKLDRAWGLGPLRGLAQKLHDEEELDAALSYSQVALMLIDANSGEVLWYDRRVGPGGCESAKTRKLVSQLAKELP